MRISKYGGITLFRKENRRSLFTKGSTVALWSPINGTQEYDLIFDWTCSEFVQDCVWLEMAQEGEARSDFSWMFPSGRVLAHLSDIMLDSQETQEFLSKITTLHHAGFNRYIVFDLSRFDLKSYFRHWFIDKDSKGAIKSFDVLQEARSFILQASDPNLLILDFIMGELLPLA